MSIVIEVDASQFSEVERRSRRGRTVVERLRARIMVLLADGFSVQEVAEMAGCVRSTVYSALYSFKDKGLEGLRDGRSDRRPAKGTPEVKAALLAYLDHVPKEYGWQRSTWTLELLALQLEREHGVGISASYIGTLLRRAGCRRGRPRPALQIPVAGRREIIERIQRLVQSAGPQEEVFYVDEADIDLNPRIGLAYLKPGQQLRVLTPGKNVKYYIAAALNARTGAIVYTHGPHKNSVLFCELLDALAHRYRRATRIHLIADNYIIHKSGRTERALHGHGGRLKLHFLPPYSPDENRIEGLWKQLHDNVTRNHRHPTMQSLWADVESFLHHAQPFPGSHVSTLRKTA